MDIEKAADKLVVGEIIWIGDAQVRVIKITHGEIEGEPGVTVVYDYLDDLRSDYTIFGASEIIVAWDGRLEQRNCPTWDIG